MSHSPETTPAVEAAVPPAQLEDFNKHLKGYVVIGGVQVAFTLLAVIAAYIPFPTSAGNIVAVLLAASINAAVVAAIQMHLKSEKAIIWRFLFFTGIFLIVLFGLTLLAWSDPIMGTSHTHH